MPKVKKDNIKQHSLRYNNEENENETPPRSPDPIPNKELKKSKKNQKPKITLFNDEVSDEDRPLKKADKSHKILPELDKTSDQDILAKSRSQNQFRVKSNANSSYKNENSQSRVQVNNYIKAKEHLSNDSIASRRTQESLIQNFKNSQNYGPEINKMRGSIVFANNFKSITDLLLEQENVRNCLRTMKLSLEEKNDLIKTTEALETKKSLLFHNRSPNDKLALLDKEILMHKKLLTNTQKDFDSIEERYLQLKEGTYRKDLEEQIDTLKTQIAERVKEITDAKLGNKAYGSKILKIHEKGLSSNGFTLNKLSEEVRKVEGKLSSIKNTHEGNKEKNAQLEKECQELEEELEQLREDAKDIPPKPAEVDMKKYEELVEMKKYLEKEIASIDFNSKRYLQTCKTNKLLFQKKIAESKASAEKMNQDLVTSAQNIKDTQEEIKTIDAQAKIKEKNKRSESTENHKNVKKVDNNEVNIKRKKNVVIEETVIEKRIIEKEVHVVNKSKKVNESHSVDKKYLHNESYENNRSRKTRNERESEESEYEERRSTHRGQRKKNRGNNYEESEESLLDDEDSARDHRVKNRRTNNKKNYRNSYESGSEFEQENESEEESEKRNHSKKNVNNNKVDLIANRFWDKIKREASQNMQRKEQNLRGRRRSFSESESESRNSSQNDSRNSSQSNSEPEKIKQAKKIVKNQNNIDLVAQQFWNKMKHEASRNLKTTSGNDDDVVKHFWNTIKKKAIQNLSGSIESKYDATNNFWVSMKMKAINQLDKEKYLEPNKKQHKVNQKTDDEVINNFWVSIKIQAINYLTKDQYLQAQHKSEYHEDKIVKNFWEKMKSKAIESFGHAVDKVKSKQDEPNATAAEINFWNKIKNQAIKELKQPLHNDLSKNQDLNSSVKNDEITNKFWNKMKHEACKDNAKLSINQKSDYKEISNDKGLNKINQSKNNPTNSDNIDLITEKFWNKLKKEASQNAEKKWDSQINNSKNNLNKDIQSEDEEDNKKKSKKTDSSNKNSKNKNNDLSGKQSDEKLKSGAGADPPKKMVQSSSIEKLDTDKKNSSKKKQ